MSKPVVSPFSSHISIFLIYVGPSPAKSYSTTSPWCGGERVLEGYTIGAYALAGSTMVGRPSGGSRGDGHVSDLQGSARPMWRGEQYHCQPSQRVNKGNGSDNKRKASVPCTSLEPYSGGGAELDRREADNHR